MATESKIPLSSALRPMPDVRRIAQLADQPALAEAQRWFVRERTWITDRHLELCRIPAPTFFEQERAEWFRSQLSRLGWSTNLDRAGNVLAVFGQESFAPGMVVSAHLDTVFAPARPEDIHATHDGRLAGPGVADNGSGLTAILALARVLAETPELHGLASSILLVANVGEEGEGNLNGMRYLCHHVPELAHISGFLVLDGPSTDHVTVQALASRRFEIIFSGPGGHSWNDYGAPNPVHAIGELISHFVASAEAKLSNEKKIRCSYSFGLLEGGSSINSIPSSARAKLDLRSEDSAILEQFASLLTASVERSLRRENRSLRGSRLTAKVKELGTRPGGKLPDHSPLLGAVQSVDSYLRIRSRINCASTDANVPLSLGLPAISIGAGGQGGGAHTSEEWYQPEGREIGLRRILLVLATLFAESGAGNSSSGE